MASFTENITLAVGNTPLVYLEKTSQESGTEILAKLESANPLQGRLRWRSDEALLLTGKDPMYLKAAQLGELAVTQNGRDSAN